MDKKDSEEEWIKVKERSKIIKKTAPYYIELSKTTYSQLVEFLATVDPPPQIIQPTTGAVARPTNNAITFKIKLAQRRQTKLAKYIESINNNGVIDMYINKAEDERTSSSRLM